MHKVPHLVMMYEKAQKNVDCIVCPDLGRRDTTVIVRNLFVTAQQFPAFYMFGKVFILTRKTVCGICPRKKFEEGQFFVRQESKHRNIMESILGLMKR